MFWKATDLCESLGLSIFPNLAGNDRVTENEMQIETVVGSQVDAANVPDAASDEARDLFR